jgi:hypothetical protein
VQLTAEQVTNPHLENPENLHECHISNKKKWISTVTHSMVSTISILSSNLERTHLGSGWSARNLILPPRQVSRANNEVQGRSLLDTMSRYIAEKPLQDWVAEDLADYSIVLFIWVIDAASSNFVMLKKYFALLTFLSVLPVYISWWIQVCELHRGNRIQKKVLKQLHLASALYCVTRALRPSRNYEVFVKTFCEEMAKNLVVLREDQRGPSDPNSRDKWRLLYSLCRVEWGKAGCESNIHQHKRFSTFWRFFQDTTQQVGALDVPVHRCCKMSCNRECKNARSAKLRAQRELKHTFFMNGIPLYDSGRWTQQTPSMERIFCLILLDKSAFISALKAVQKKTKDDKRSIRLGKAINSFDTSDVRFRCLQGLLSAKIMSPLMTSLFKLHAVDTSARDQKSHFTSAYQRVKLVDDLMATIWDAISGMESPRVTQVFGGKAALIQEVLLAFYPHADDPSRGRFQVYVVLLQMYGELWVKFGKEQTMWPYVLTRGEDFECDSTKTFELERFWREKVLMLRVDADDFAVCCHFRLVHSWRARLREDPPALRWRTLRGLYFQWSRGKNKDSTLDEERWNGFQKTVSGGVLRQPGSFTAQVVESSLEQIRRNFSAMGGRCLDAAPEALSKAFKGCTSSHHTVYKRDKQNGQANFLYASKKIEESVEGGEVFTPDAKRQRRSELSTEYFSLTPEQQKPCPGLFRC